MSSYMKLPNRYFNKSRLIGTMYMMGVKSSFLRTCLPLLGWQKRGLKTMRDGGIPFYASALNAIDF